MCHVFLNHFNKENKQSNHDTHITFRSFGDGVKLQQN